MKHPLTCCALLAGSLLAASCKPPKSGAIIETREISSYARKPEADISNDTRFYNDARKPQQPNFRDMLAWDVPAGWTEVEPDAAGMRLVNLTFGPNGEGECYISLMPGSAGGLAANVNRWRTQMGQPTYTDDEIAALPKKPFFNKEATFVAFDGDFKGFGAGQAKTGYRLLGLIHSADQATIFVKLTGPKALVEQNAAAFEAFTQSIRPNMANLPKQ